MKIAVTSTGDNLDSNIDMRFGRCKYFIIVDSESMKFKVVSNKSVMASGGAGIKAAETIANQDVEIVLTGNIGPNSHSTLKAAGIKVFTGVTGTIKDAVNKYKNNELSETNSSNVNSHSGIR
jgi:predicted Fe-Mo cluster-binding NifX family protein